LTCQVILAVLELPNTYSARENEKLTVRTWTRLSWNSDGAHL